MKPNRIDSQVAGLAQPTFDVDDLTCGVGFNPMCQNSVGWAERGTWNILCWASPVLYTLRMSRVEGIK